MKLFDCAILFSALVVFMAHLYYASPLTSDAYQTLRESKLLGSGGSFPLTGSAINSDGTVYPPIFLLAFHSLKTFVGSEFLAFNFLSYIFVFLIFTSTYLFLRRIIGNEEYAALGALAIFTIPIVVYRVVLPIPETLGVVLFLLSINLFEREKYRFLGFLLAIFPFAHTRSFVFTVATLAILAVFRKKYFEFAKSAAVGVAVFLLYRNAFPINAIGFENLAIITPGILDSYSILAIALTAIGIFAMWKNGKKREYATFSTIIAFEALYFLLPFPFRHVIFLLLPTAYFASLVFSLDRRLAIIFAVFLPLTVASAMQMRTEPFGFEAITTFKEMGNFEGGNAIANFKDNYALPYFGNKKVVVGAFAEGMGDGNLRTAELAKYFDANDISAKRNLLEKYEIRLGAFEKKAYDFTYEEGIAIRKLIDSDNFAVFGFG
ncbi:hypothetical protein HY989_03785 [Candidatus Micrarchaeota archaeon]|nr:hypothetical protein [Candidatus Micrarchaeota archaeon]